MKVPGQTLNVTNSEPGTHHFISFLSKVVLAMAYKNISSDFSDIREEGKL